MWIAKPFSSLSEPEKKAWVDVCRSRAARDSFLDPVPLSQTLTWAQGILAVSGLPYFVFNPEEKIGGLVFSSVMREGPKRGTHFECINGPLLDWDDSNEIPRQLATFAMAVSKLAQPGRVEFPFRSLKIQPRFEKTRAEHRLQALPIEALSIQKAATLRVSLQSTLELQRSLLAPRLRRTLRRSEKLSFDRGCKRLEISDLKPFVPKMQSFAYEKGFTVPPLGWFLAISEDRALLESEGISFWMAWARLKEEGRGELESEILVCIQNSEAHYLFGRESRVGDFPTSWSAAVVSQYTMIEHLIHQGIASYDLNGFVADVPEDHPYAGVCEFKNQFGGQVVEYEVPHFLIE